MKIVLKKQYNGRWFGVIKDSDDGHGNEIDCLQYTPEEALGSLMEQLKEVKERRI